ncbi:hypothetical protein PUP68_00305 [Pseudomonas chlororaphis]|uniref:hypothetical protein n=1 Tax=Pseudomonas chlororaphis TaxID=587753 RepID=UPI0009BA0153|nr:hypothetical protein [Pseudomonas chlororaphis]WDG81376.1 hypothetical protein PUP77_11935 [Pseudomonas chlororaphis]WDG85571.1 hypothetical protein PUP68_00305 [Pseudomonas chlororaphis]WDG91884.1 hypothetical protein PUP49_00285 [Pseudomonas chlororaphis]
MVSNISCRRWFWLGLFFISCFAHAAGFRFEDYKVAEIFRGEHHEVVTQDEPGDNWVEDRKEAIKQPVDFAGHYVVYTNGCGGGAICGEILDVETGEVVASFPNAYYILGDDGKAPFTAVHKPDSRLLIVIGVAADPEVGLKGESLPSKNRQRFYEFSNNELRLVKVIEK